MKGRGDRWLWGINTESWGSCEVPAQFTVLRRGTCELRGGWERAVVY